MIPQETTPLILILCIALLMCTAVLAMAWGKRLPRQGAWLTWIGFAGLFVALGISGDSLVRNNLQPYYWLRGWVWPREELGAIAVGILQDFAGIGVSTLAAILSVLIVFNGALFTREPRSERVYSAIAFGAAGVALSWLAASPWLAFMGISLSVFGGFLSLGNRWDSNREADSAIRYAWERAWGLVFAMLGASILASTRRGLVWGSVELASPDSLSVNTAGAILLVLGLFVQTQSFPFFGRMVAVSETQPAIRVFASQVLPALAAFSILFRFEAQLRSVGVFPVFGWIALASAILTLLSGILQNSWRSGLSLFCAAGFSMSLAALALTSSQAGMEILLSTSLGSVVLALAGCAIECEGDAHSSLKQRATWAKIGGFSGAWIAAAMVGSVGAGGVLQWLLSSAAQPGVSTGYGFAYFLMVLLAFKEAWLISKLKASASTNWYAVLSPLLLAILSLGVIWNGTATGGLLPGNADALVHSVLEGFFPSVAPPHFDEGTLVTATSIYWSLAPLAVFVAFWIVGRKENLVEKATARMGRAGAFIAGGYGVDLAIDQLRRGLAWVGGHVQEFIDGMVWEKAIPDGLAAVLRRSSEGMAAADRWLTAFLAQGLRKSVEIPGKVFQLIQTGDVRWYLFFAVASGVAILTLFMRL